MAADPWGGSTNGNNNGSNWAQFGQANTEQAQATTGRRSLRSTMIRKHRGYSIISGALQYRILYDYAGERADELSISAGDIVTVSEKMYF